jgi:exopolysaccharide biosynthesis polyprenyl glycosylphosphotransferase
VRLFAGGGGSRRGADGQRDGAMLGQAIVTGRKRQRARHVVQNAVGWKRRYLRWAVVADCACALAAGLLAVEVRFDGHASTPAAYVAFTIAMPGLWWITVALAGGYDPRFIGVGSDEFRRVLNAAVTLTAAIAIVSFAFKLDVARGYIAVAMPTVAVLDLVARHQLRKRLHRQRRLGSKTHRVMAVGHAAAVADLIATLHRDTCHGLSVVGACLVGHGAGQEMNGAGQEISGVPVLGGLGSVTSAVKVSRADTVAVLACPEMNGTRLREMAWKLEESNTDLYLAPALLDVAGPRTTIRPIAGLPLLHVDHPELSGPKLLLKAVFDRAMAALALLLVAPLFAAIAIVIRADSRGPALFKQTRVGKDGRTFGVYKFRTMVVDAEQRKAELEALNEGSGLLFKMRRDPRVTRVGSWLRRWSLDELPQLINVLRGDMSLVGPRPALPQEAAGYGDYMRRRLVVKPGITGLWQVSGRSDLPWEEAVRLDLRYVENWSFALDLQILWKTCSAVLQGSGAY